jgi:hypothetical protein
MRVTHPLAATVLGLTRTLSSGAGWELCLQVDAKRGTVRRGIYTELTPAGRALYAEARPVHDETLARALELAEAQPELAPVVQALSGVAFPA